MRAFHCILVALAFALPGGSLHAAEIWTAADSLATPKAPTIQWDALPDYRHQPVSPVRLGTVLGGTGAANLAFYQTLKKPWWSGETSSFHFIHDWWGNYAMEVDKLGHAYSAQVLARLSAKSYQWAGFTRRQALFWGGVTSLATMTQIEVLDGFTSAYGFSTADYAANIAGAFWPLAQDVWSPLRVVTFKMSYRTHHFEEAVAPNIIEDYNRQTYWLAFDINAMLPREARRYWPDWLGIALGYGVHNAFTYNTYREYHTTRPSRTYLYTQEPARLMREYYVALDIDPTRLVPENSRLAELIAPLKYIHLPSPAIRLRADGTRFFALYF